MRRVANADATRGAERIARLSRSSRDSQNPKSEAQRSIKISPDETFNIFHNTLLSYQIIDNLFFENICARAFKKRTFKLTKQCYSQTKSRERDIHFAYATWNFQWKQIKPQWKSWFPHFPGDASLPANSVESGGKGNGVAHLCHFTWVTHQTHRHRPTLKYPADPFLQSRTLETSLHLPLGRSSRLALIQLKTSDDRAKQRRIDHENFNWCYRYERG